MRLELKTFLSPSTLHCFTTMTKKDKVIALVACAVLGLCAIIGSIQRYHIKLKSTEKPVPSISETKTEDSIGEKIKSTFNSLFEDSPYLVENLPIYPIVLSQEHPKPTRENMNAVVMKGSNFDGRSFIAIKVNCDNLEKVVTFFQAFLEGDLVDCWSQLPGGSRRPAFFDYYVTNLDASLIEGEGVEKVRQLFKKGTTVDLNKKHWTLPKS